MITPTARARAEQLARALKVGKTVKPPAQHAGWPDYYADVPWNEGIDAILAYADEIRREEREKIVKIVRDLEVPHTDEFSWAMVPLADAERIVEAIRSGRGDRGVDAMSLEFTVAQLRHAYHNLIGPDAAWDRDQRMRFADGLIGPQIERIEDYLKSQAPSPDLGGLIGRLERQMADNQGVINRGNGVSPFAAQNNDVLREVLTVLQQISGAEKKP